ncbi:hypothetical protein NDA18_003196 [Ustilago nuda]|nr:hypothetical protein NDA18_003196 [Ustilago nuda]
MPSSVAKHTIPPFYACYFLRSLSSPGITYIGSTPAPPRRKRQHNGDLTHGAYKTARARPWEMECIVYGFPSKIAALQFEWAWAKPNLSRHLKFLATEHTAGGVATDTAAWTGMPLFPSTSMTPTQTRWGRPKRQRARSPSTPNARLLTMRALLRSEPFCGWGLKLAFFTEWSWLAYKRLEALSASNAESGLRLDRYSRSGKLLHPLYPVAVCDFTGVDGKRTPLVHVSQQHRLNGGVADQPAKKKQSSSKKKTNEDDEAARWHETLPRTANLKGLDACIQDFDLIPVSAPAPLNSDLTKKAKRVTKASKAAATAEHLDEEEEGVDDEYGDAEFETAATATTAADGTAQARALRRMRFDDTDAEELEWQQFEHVLSVQSCSINDFIQTCVERHIAAQDSRTVESAPIAPTNACAICKEPIDLTRQLEFVLCPTPYACTQPVISRASSTDAGVQVEASKCSSNFHLSCLADGFLQQQEQSQNIGGVTSSSTNTVLPTHGSCPSHECGGPAEVATWEDVVRRMYRRHERFERLLQFLVRSGKTLDEHLEPTKVKAPAKAQKARGKAKAKITEADVADDDTAAATTGKKAKAKAKRKSVGSTEIEAANAQEGVLNKVEERSKVRKKTTSRQAKAVVDPGQVIDLT